MSNYSKYKEYYYNYHKEYRKQNKEKINEYHRKYYENNKRKVLLNTIKQRAKKKELEFNLELSDIDIPEYCPILLIKLNQNKTIQDNSPSIDRIDNSKGYIKGNIQVISQLANVMKNKATKEQLLLFAGWIIKTYA